MVLSHRPLTTPPNLVNLPVISCHWSTLLTAQQLYQSCVYFRRAKLHSAANRELLAIQLAPVASECARDAARATLGAGVYKPRGERALSTIPHLLSILQVESRALRNTSLYFQDARHTPRRYAAHCRLPRSSPASLMVWIEEPWQPYGRVSPC